MCMLSKQKPIQMRVHMRRVWRWSLVAVVLLCVCAIVAHADRVI